MNFMSPLQYSLPECYLEIASERQCFLGIPVLKAILKEMIKECITQ